MARTRLMRSTLRIGGTVAVALALTSGPPRSDAASIEPRIVNGVVTASYPSAGALLAGSNPLTARLGCSGTLIGCETFLTAAHCVCPTTGADCTGAKAPNPAGWLVFLQHAGFFTVSSVALQSSFDFPVDDIAVLKLGAPVTGIAPTPLMTTDVGFGVRATIAGFGRSGGGAGNSDYGIKRAGDVTTAACRDSASDPTLICWQFTDPLGAPGTDSNTCNGDSGGPLFVDDGSGVRVAGVTAGGMSLSCLTPDNSFDTRVSFHADWIQSVAGTDLSNTTCGLESQVGDAMTTVLAFSGQLSSSNPRVTHPITVASGRTTLRIAMNGVDSSPEDFDLYVKAGSPPTTSSFDCKAADSGQFAFCEFTAPAPGIWYALVDRYSGSGPYQLTATLFGPDCSQPDAEGIACDDNDPCTEDDICQSGTCLGAPVSDGAPCDDGEQCTSESCQAGVCTPLALTGTPCEDGSTCTRNDTCSQGSCVPGIAPFPSCKRSLVPRKSSLLLRDRTNGKDKLAWRWTQGEQTNRNELGNPRSSTVYALCLFDESSAKPRLIMERRLPTGGNWSATATGFKYKDPIAANQGLFKAILKAGADGAAKMVVKGEGPGLGLSSLRVDTLHSVRMQLLSDGGCWEAHFTSAENDPGTFQAKSD